MEFIYDDGGREKAGFKGNTGDCVCRAFSIILGKDYKEVYEDINTLGAQEHTGKRKKSKSHARTGVYKRTSRKYLKSKGMIWVPTMFIGSGCRVHLKKEELPAGRLVVEVSRHTTAVIDGVIHDTYNPSRDETRCVYGYYMFPNS